MGIRRKKRAVGPKKASAAQRCFVVGIGSSAGGLEALRSLFGALQPTKNLSFVVVQHLSPVHRSRLVELIGHSTNFQVKEVRDGIQPAPGIVYITPPNKDVRIEGGKLVLQRPAAKIGPKPSVDLFFRSLAEEAGENAVGIVLSGTGTDGTMGIRAIKSLGGLTISQKTGSAKYDGMPKSAAHSGMVDLELTTDEIARELARIDQRGGSAAHAHHEEDAKEAEPFRKVLRQLTAQTGVSFDQYKQSTLRRRVERRVVATGSAGTEAYAAFLEAHPEEARNLLQDVLISVTSFFRDAESFRKLSDRLLRRLKDRKRGSNFRAWVVGCATGEEAVSVAIVLNEALEKLKSRVKPQVFATDLDENALEFARRGIYPKNAFADFPPRWREKYFLARESGLQVRPELRDMLIFARHNISEDPPFLDIELLSCRNVMIYFNSTLQDQVLRVFQYALQPKGLLFLGRSETVPTGSRHFEVVDKTHRIYERNSVVPEIRSVSLKRENGPEARRPAESRRKSEEDSADELIRCLAPSSVLLDQDFNVAKVFGSAGTYFEVPVGRATQDITKLLPPPLSFEAMMLLRQAQKTKRIAEGHSQTVKARGRIAFVRLRAVPLVSAKLPQILLQFAEEEAQGSKIQKGKGGQKQLRRLEYELDATRAHLQAVIEDRETSNEELQAMNEELQSANEELQSTNEELETTNEELQSTNEELITLNEEVNTKSAELGAVNLELQATQNAVSYPILVLDRKRRLIRFNSAARHLFRLGESDLGEALPSTVNTIDFLPIHRLLEALSGKTEKLKDHFHALNRTFNAEAHPIRNRKGELEMVVISFVENTEIVTALEESRLNRDRLSSILENTLAVVCMKDIGGIYLYANSKYYTVTGVAEKEAVGRTDDEIFGSEVGLRLRERDLAVLKSKSAVQVDESFVFGGRDVHWAASRFPLFDGAGRVQAICMVAIDISDRVADQRTIARQQEELSVYGKFSTVAEISAGIAHEVNTPLNVITTKTDLLRKVSERGQLDPAAVKRLTADIERMARNISSIVLGLKSVAGLDADLGEVASLQKVVQDALKICEFRLQRFGVDVRIEMPTEEVRVFCFPVQIMQVIINLVNNSLDAMKDLPERWIRITFFETATEYCLRVIDAGAGIPDDIAEKIMTPFFTTKKTQQGTGIGLSLSRSIARRHGGELELDRSQKNTSFVLRIPRSPHRKEGGDGG